MTTQTGRGRARRAVRGAAVAAFATGLTIGLGAPAALADPGSTAPATPQPTPTATAPGQQTAGTPGAQSAAAPDGQPTSANSAVPQFTNVDQLIMYIDQEYDTGAGGGELSNLIKSVMKLRAAGYRPSKQNAQAIIAALDERPNQKPLIAALTETLGYQQKIKAQNEMLQQAAAAKNGQNSAVMGAGQMPSYGAPAAPAPWPGGGGEPAAVPPPPAPSP